jgi:hypothetical protein
MAKPHAGQRARTGGAVRKRTPARRLGKRPTGKRVISRPASKSSRRATTKSGKRATKKASMRASKKGSRRAAAKKRSTRSPVKGSTPSPVKKVALSRPTVDRQGPTRRRVTEPVALGKKPRLDRARRTLDETVPTPPSSLNLDRRSSAVRTGRAEIRESQQEHRGMSPEITAGDVDVDLEDAYFTGDEAPGGDNPTPDQDVVDDIGKALGVEYQDAEELKASDKVVERDRHRWELDPASSEDYKDRK